ncbi:MAG: metallophosphoesterase [Lachnospiraceae bacterium]|nr:metallophosphoesterase [Lachnospiraceae bacterium]
MLKKLNKKARYIIISCVVILGVFLIAWTVWDNITLTVTGISVSSDRLPPSFSGFRIVQISDMHNAEFGENNKTLLKAVSDAGPDIIVITGDFVDARHTNIKVSLDFAEKAVEIAPVYYVTGNHEARLFRYDELKNGLETAGVIVLEDTSVYLERGDEKIVLLGLSDPGFTIEDGGFDEISAMVSARLNSMLEQETVYSVLLSHRPELFETYAACGVDLILSGHVHGGQFRLPFLGGLFAPSQGLFPKYDAGLYTKGVTNMVISRGLGNSVMPVRINNRPEIVLIELTAE